MTQPGNAEGCEVHSAEAQQIKDNILGLGFSFNFVFRLFVV